MSNIRSKSWEYTPYNTSDSDAGVDRVKIMKGNPTRQELINDGYVLMCSTCGCDLTHVGITLNDDEEYACGGDAVYRKNTKKKKERKRRTRYYDYNRASRRYNREKYPNYYDPVIFKYGDILLKNHDITLSEIQCGPESKLELIIPIELISVLIQNKSGVKNITMSIFVNIIGHGDDLCIDVDGNTTIGEILVEVANNIGIQPYVKANIKTTRYIWYSIVLVLVLLYIKFLV